MLHSILARLDVPTRMALPPVSADRGLHAAGPAAPAAKPVPASPPMPASQELVAFERTRLSIAAESKQGNHSLSYSLEATFTYTRIATGVQSNPTPVAATPVAVPEAEGETPVTTSVPGADDDAATNGGTSSPPVSDALPLETPARPSFSFYEHVLFNATSMTVSMTSRHVTPPLTMQSASTAQQSPLAIPTSDEGVDPAPKQAVQRLSADDYAQSFSRMKMRHSESTIETSLSLKLTTREGDTVELDFRQLEVLSRLRMKGVAEGGELMRVRQNDSSMERAVRMNVEGDLSQAELAAIDSLLNEVVHVANKFFSGDVRAAWDRLLTLEFTSDELAEFSLRMSVAHTKQVTKAYQGEGGLAGFAARDKQALEVLEYLAGEQRSLIESARAHFDDASAVSLVRELLPQLLPSEPQEVASEEPAVVA